MTIAIIPATSIESYQEFDPYRGMSYNGDMNQIDDDPALAEIEYKLNDQPLGLPTSRNRHHVEHESGSAFHSVVGFHHGGIFHTDARTNGNHINTDILGNIRGLETCSRVVEIYLSQCFLNFIRLREGHP